MVLDLRHRVPGGGESIVTDGPGYRLLVDDDGLDVRQFDRYLARAREAEASGSTPHAIVELRAALALWRGPALAALDGPLIAPAAAVLDERRLAVTEHLMELRLAAGDARELVAELQPLLAEHPLRETLRGQLMLALCRWASRPRRCTYTTRGGGCSATSSASIRAASSSGATSRSCTTTPPWTRRRRRLRLTPSARPRCPTTSPTSPAARRRLARSRAAVESASPRGLTIITIDGMAGIGKTTLAVHAAHRLAEDFPDGQLFIDLHGFTPGHDPVDPGAALDTLLRAIGVPGGRDPRRPRVAVRPVAGARRRSAIPVVARQRRRHRADQTPVAGRAGLPGADHQPLAAGQPRRRYTSLPVAALARRRAGLIGGAARSERVPSPRRSINSSTRAGGCRSQCGLRRPGSATVRSGRCDICRPAAKSPSVVARNSRSTTAASRQPSGSPTTACGPITAGCFVCWACTRAPTSMRTRPRHWPARRWTRPSA